MTSTDPSLGTRSTEPRRLPTPGAVLALPCRPGDSPSVASLAHVVRLAGGDDAVIAVLASTAPNPAGTGAAYVARFRQLGARDATWLPLWQRCDAGSRDVLAVLRRATGVFIADGDRAQLQMLLAETDAIAAIQRRHREGAVVAGLQFEAVPAGLPALGGRREPSSLEPVRLAGLAELGIGAEAAVEFVPEAHLSYAVEWSAH